MIDEKNEKIFVINHLWLLSDPRRNSFFQRECELIMSATCDMEGQTPSPDDFKALDYKPMVVSDHSVFSYIMNKEISEYAQENLSNDERNRSCEVSIDIGTTDPEFGNIMKRILDRDMNDFHTFELSLNVDSYKVDGAFYQLEFEPFMVSERIQLSLGLHLYIEGENSSNESRIAFHFDLEEKD